MFNNARIRWLKIGAILTLGSGLLIAVAAMPALQGPVNLMADFIFFPLDSAQSVDTVTARLFSAITGGLMVGIGVMLWVVATELCPRDPALGRRLILFGVGSWYVVDCAMSVAAGAPLNVLFNTGFLLIFVLPAWGLADSTSS
ncbi:MAG: hypothetical protein QNJ11_08900 [Woeseiaceae bacterium]|nr:hypothetical protein [Woeseiaceae bacterium]